MSEPFFQCLPVEAQVVLGAMRDVSGILGRLLDGGHSAEVSLKVERNILDDAANSRPCGKGSWSSPRFVHTMDIHLGPSPGFLTLRDADLAELTVSPRILPGHRGVRPLTSRSTDSDVSCFSLDMRSFELG